jgi:hypothetical protein
MYKFEASRPSQAVRPIGQIARFDEKGPIWRAFLHLEKSPGGEIDPERRRIPESLRPTVSKIPF